MLMQLIKEMQHLLHRQTSVLCYYYLLALCLLLRIQNVELLLIMKTPSSLKSQTQAFSQYMNTSLMG